MGGGYRVRYPLFVANIMLLECLRLLYFELVRSVGSRKQRLVSWWFTETIQYALGIQSTKES